MSEKGIATVDIAALRLAIGEADSDRFQRFVSAIETASRLGYAVSIRVVNDPRSEKPRPINLYAVADVLSIRP